MSSPQKVIVEHRQSKLSGCLMLTVIAAILTPILLCGGFFAAGMSLPFLASMRETTVEPTPTPEEIAAREKMVAGLSVTQRAVVIKEQIARHTGPQGIYMPLAVYIKSVMHRPESFRPISGEIHSMDDTVLARLKYEGNYADGDAYERNVHGEFYFDGKLKKITYVK